MTKRIRLLLLLIAATLFTAGDSFACAVCFGDPNSPMTLGAKAGILLMLGVLGFVLAGIACATFYFIRRSRLVQVQAAVRGESSSDL